MPTLRHSLRHSVFLCWCVCIGAFLLGSNSLWGQSPLTPLSGLELGFTVAETRDGSALLGGYGPKGPVVVRMDGTRERWRLVCDWGAGQVVAYPAQSLVELKDGSLSAAATGAGLHPSESALWVLRMDAQGRKHWEKRWALKDTNIFAQAVIETEEGHLLALGLAPDRGLVLVEYDREGKLLRDRVLPKESPHSLPDVDNFRQGWAGFCPAPGGGLYVAWTEQIRRSRSEPDAEGRLCRLDASWKPVWKASFGAPLGEQVLLTGLAPHPKEGVMLLAEGHRTPLEERDTAVGVALHVSSEGKILATRHFGHGGDFGVHPRALVSDQAGGFHVAGFGSDLRTDPRHVAWLARMDALGRISEVRTLRAHQGLWVYATAPARQGGTYQGGAILRNGRMQGAILRVDPAVKPKEAFVPPPLVQR